MDNAALLSELTLEEKTSDGINGVRPAAHDSEMTTACFPNTICLASTWDAELLTRLGQRLVTEAHMKGSQFVLGPTINIHRDPRAGRNFECFSEDPLLSGQLAGAIVNGVQAGGVGSVAKHLVCNDSEFMRHHYNVDLSLNARAFREIYLAAWQHLLRSSDPVGLMTAYNMVNGQACSENKGLLDIVRNDWGYKGIFMSDWFGTYSTEAPIKAGLDLEMPFPVQRGPKLIAAVESGAISMEEIDARVLKMLEVRDRTRPSHRYQKEYSEVTPETVQVARDLAAGGIVLLKNDNNVLPVQASVNPKIAVIGEFGQMPVVTGGGSASCNPQYLLSPVEAIRKAIDGDETTVRYASGVRTRRIIPVAEKQYLQAENGQPGVDVCYYNDDEPSTPVCKEYIDKATVWMFGRYKEGLKVPGSHLVMTTKLKAPSTGRHTLAVRATGAFTLQIDDEEVLTGVQPDVTPEQTLFNHIRLESRVDVPLVGDQVYNIKLTMKSRDRLIQGEPTPYAATLCFEEYYDEAVAIQEAAGLAKASDTAIIFAGRDGQYESEGFDMESITLPENQTRLIKAVAAAAKKTVVILHSGNPIDVSPFIDDVDAVVAAHFYGQEGPDALADILTGKVNPSGRLATTWPKDLESTPSHGNFPSMKNEHGKYTIKYEEGLQLGYRHPDASWVRWPFGHGLSYTEFAYSDLKASVVEKDGKASSAHSLVCSVRVANTGAVAGREVVQVYVTPTTPTTDSSTTSSTSVWRPKRELKGFKKVLLQPGESKTVTLDMDLKAACSYWSEDESAWCLEPGVYGIVVGPCRAEFEVKEGAKWTHL
ncbi:hypothetical protein NLU13_8929 [Sarocladium strictum]|uniref:beta-glucosidase n=1 Tax=Sarocladium strictum TaxID=5046 RepID=A0AA39L3Q2_SARSR|nr:hypothetical protein NLU13_8929 [Sarocladium strictum]